jgi:hypothetical protein
VEEAFVPQTHPPGAEAEVDFADLWIDLAGVRTKVFLFTLRCSYSGKAVHRAFATQGQEAFLEGHQHAFDVLGGIPFDKIRYDNLKSAVARVLFGRNRLESDRWVAFRSHHHFDAFYCQPGIDGAHEKGGVEGEGGRFRRTHLVPVPKVNSERGVHRLWHCAARRGALLSAVRKTERGRAVSCLWDGGRGRSQVLCLLRNCPRRRRRRPGAWSPPGGDRAPYLLGALLRPGELHRARRDP